jgi:hypothetical protein
MHAWGAAIDLNHFEMNESLGNPYGLNGRAALALMKLSAWRQSWLRRRFR